MNDNQRQLLGTFLRTRRERLTPPEAGINASTRRRTSGLRREEVAQLAGISVTWYTWIEQGRDVQCSAQVLESLAHVLRLQPHEKAYLFSLVGLQPHPQSQAAAQVSASLHHLLEHQGHYPAYIMGRYWQMLAWNPAAAALFGDFGAMPLTEQNMIAYVFLRPETRAFLLHWEERAERLVAEFRIDCRNYLDDPYLTEMVAHISRASPDFKRCWDGHNVELRDGGRRDFIHPTLGHLVFHQTTLRLSNDDDMKVIIHTPQPDEQTNARWKVHFETLLS